MRAIKEHISILLSFVLLAFLVGCEKDYYTSSNSNESDNPLFEDGAIVPADFTWASMQALDFSVQADGVYSDNYFYIIEVFDSNPLFSSKANLLTMGVSNAKVEFSTRLLVPNHLSTLYVKQTDPTGKKKITEVVIVGNKIHVDFSEKTAPKDGRLRSAPTGVILDYDTPINATVIDENTPSSYTLNPSQSYVIRGVYTGALTFPGGGNTSLFIEGKWINTTSQITLQGGSKLIFQPGSFFETTNHLVIMGNVDAKLVVAPDANFIQDESAKVQLNFTSNGHIINGGSLTLNKITVPDAAVIYNYGTMNVDEFNLNSTNNTTNDGLLHVKKATFVNGNINNNCLLIFDEISTNGTVFNLSPLTLMSIKDYTEANGTTFNLDSKSKLEVTELISFKVRTSVINGVGVEKSLASLEKVLIPGYSILVEYKGQLNVETSQHPVNPQYNPVYSISAPAYFTAAGETDVDIPSTECNGGGNSSTPGYPPTLTEFPIIYEGLGLSYLFEDNWPFLGDYDMNDLVLDIVPSYELNQANLVNALSMQINLRAVGATKGLAVGLQLDDILKTNIASVTRSTNLGLTGEVFSLTNDLESGQTKAVIPIFDSAHKAFGLTNRDITNTTEGKPHLPEVSLSLRIEFNVPQEQSALSVDKLNVFIINGGYQQKRHEIHLLGYEPTDKADFSRLDFGDVSSTELYRSKGNMIWALAVPASINYPKEWTTIAQAYPNFTQWVLSGGQTNKDWYLSPSDNFIYKE